MGSFDGQGEFHGREGFMDFFAEWIDAYEEWRHELRNSSTRVEGSLCDDGSRARLPRQ